VGAWIEMAGGTLRRGGRPASLPVWERGLKFYPHRDESPDQSSLPVWERGLKFDLEKLCDKEQSSLPVWERGLK